MLLLLLFYAGQVCSLHGQYPVDPGVSRAQGRKVWSATGGQHKRRSQRWAHPPHYHGVGKRQQQRRRQGFAVGWTASPLVLAGHHDHPAAALSLSVAMKLLQRHIEQDIESSKPNTSSWLWAGFAAKLTAYGHCCLCDAL
jgi:hypothetical protein